MLSLTTNRYDWGFACGRVSALEAQRLDKDYAAGLLGQARLEDVFRQLQELPVGALLPPGAPWEDSGAHIDRFYYEHLLSLRSDCPDPAVVNLFLLSGDFLNLKHALLGERTFPFPAGVIPAELLTRLAEGDLSALDDGLRAAIERLGVLETAERARRVDAVLDGAYLRHLLVIAAQIDAPLISGYIEDLVLARAVSVLWRAQRSEKSMREFEQDFLPLDPYTLLLSELAAVGDVKNWPPLVGGALGALLAEATTLEDGTQVAAFEQAATNRLMAMARQGLGQVSGPERILYYCALVQVEAYNLKLAVCGRVNRIDPQVLRQRLRETHG